MRDPANDAVQLRGRRHRGYQSRSWERFIGTMKAATGSSTLAADQPTPNLPGFGARKVRSNGVACTSQAATAKTTSCLTGQAKDCGTQVEDTLSRGECVKLSVGMDATIEAGSHSFDWVRVRVQGQPQPLWSPRHLILE